MFLNFIVQTANRLCSFTCDTVQSARADHSHPSGCPTDNTGPGRRGAPVLRSGTGALPQMRQVTYRISMTTDSGDRLTGGYYRKPKKVKSEKMGA